MDGPLSTSDGSDGFSSLEERIVKTERGEDEAHTTIRLSDWQIACVNNIKNSIGTNQVEIIRCAYIEGLVVVRDLLGEELKGIKNMFNKIHQIISVSGFNPEKIDDIKRARKNITRLEITIDEDYEIDDVHHLYIEKSVFSEVNDIIVDSLFGGWFHRVLISVGLYSSQVVGGDGGEVSHYVNDILPQLEDSLEETRDSLEFSFLDYVRSHRYYWSENGISEDFYDSLCSVHEMMETEHKEEVEFHLDSIKSCVEG